MARNSTTAPATCRLRRMLRRHAARQSGAVLLFLCVTACDAMRYLSCGP